jgi:hypothetical protein
MTCSTNARRDMYKSLVRKIFERLEEKEERDNIKVDLGEVGREMELA